MKRHTNGRFPVGRRRVLGGLAVATLGATLNWRASRASTVGVVTPEGFGAVGDGRVDDAIAFRLACRHCASTGDTLRLAARRYRGARIEVHGSFDVLGQGATVDYLGIGSTVIEGRGAAGKATPTAWPQEPYAVAAGLSPVRMSVLVRPADPGATRLPLNTTGVQPGDVLFLADRPTSMSSGGIPGNYIPSDFAFVQVSTVVAGGVTIARPLPLGFASGAGVFTTPGLAVSCRISDLTIATDEDAYQHVVRSGIDILLERIDFAGKSAVGACTFSDSVTYRDCRVQQAYGPLSAARGCGRIVVDGLTFATRRNPPTAEPFAIFIEESFRDIEIRRVEAEGAGFSIRSVDLGRASTRARLTIDQCSFRSDNATAQPTGPFQGGVAIGVDIGVTNSVFVGAAIRPDAGFFPGINQRALTWMASIQAQDVLSFTDCIFESVNGGVAFAGGGGFQGNLRLDPRMNRFVGCQPPA